MNGPALLRGAALAAMLMSLPSLAAAQGYGPPRGRGGPPGPPPAGPSQDERGFWPRGGLYGGLGIGFGSTVMQECDFCDEDTFEGVSFHGNIGWKFNPQLGILLDFWPVFVPGFEIVDGPFVDDASMSNGFFTVGAQVWLLPALWVKGGIGGAAQQFHTEFDTYDGNSGPAFMLAGGYEILHSPNFSIDLELRLGAASYEEENGGTVTNLALDISMNFHQLMFWGGY